MEGESTVEIIPDVSECVETKARKEYNRLYRLYLNNEEQAGNKLEMLKDFLEKADFKKLRSESEKTLLGGKGVKFLIYREQDATEYKMEVEP